MAAAGVTGCATGASATGHPVAGRPVAGQGSADVRGVADVRARGDVRALRDVYAPYFAIGAAVQPQTLDSHREILTSHMSSITAENHMKLHMLRPSAGTVDYSGADRIVAFATEHAMRVRGHTLLWHEAAPDWFFRDATGAPATPEAVRERLRQHVTELVGRYRGRVYAWDVVNEAVSDSPAQRLRQTQWLDVLGPDYIADVFRWAHDADPDALLFYNDYSMVDPAKRDRTIALLGDLLADGVPVHGVGMQGHWTLRWPSVREIDRSIRAFADLGLRVEITELDISFYDWSDQTTRFDRFTPEMDQALAARYGEIFEVFRRHADAIDAVTFWGAADDVSWLNYIPVRDRPNYPLLFDRAHQPKAAFFAVTRF
ncbi:MAG: endo-1,4-beta-xylanase [Spirochaetaceae bacterium]|nr:MAG: endo-1,4-beta-xylanase [Spirochaetaceae bacterium]